MYQSILITGGAGFVGSNLAIMFKTDNPNTRVISLDNLKRRGSELNITRLKHAGIEFLHGDIRNKEDLKAAGPFELMIECSAEPSVLAGFNESPEYLINTNLMGTINCLESVRKFQADIIFLSTSRVYPIKKINQLKYLKKDTRFTIDKYQEITGISEKGISELFPLSGARSLYGATKLASELILQEYIDMYCIRGIINRCGVLTGPWQMGKVDQGIIVLWIAKHIFQGNLSYIGFGGTGKQVRDILHIHDLYQLLVKQISRMDQCSGEIFNIGGGNELSVSLCELTRLCRDITGNHLDIGAEKKNRDADIPYYVTDYSKIKEKIGWYPQLDLNFIIQDITDWIRDNRQLLKPILT